MKENNKWMKKDTKWCVFCEQGRDIEDILLESVE